MPLLLAAEALVSSSPSSSSCPTPTLSTSADAAAACPPTHQHLDVWVGSSEPLEHGVIVRPIAARQPAPHLHVSYGVASFRSEAFGGHGDCSDRSQRSRLYFGPMHPFHRRGGAATLWNTTAHKNRRTGRRRRPVRRFFRTGVGVGYPANTRGLVSPGGMRLQPRLRRGRARGLPCIGGD
jgi:hypothetical protein